MRVRSLFDRGLLASSSFVALQEALHELGPERLLPEEVRPKNAYNLVRLLHSCRHWLEHGTPLIAVEGVLKDELLAIKRSEVPLTQTLARAFEIADSIDDAARACTKLPEAPDFTAADAFLRAARRQAARVLVGADGTSLGATSIAGPPPDTDLFALRFFPQPLPSDVDVSALRRFVEVHWLERLQTVPARPIFFALTGAHAYGFPSPDSDLDLKAMHVVPAARLLGLRSAPAPLERVVPDWEGREMDLSSHDMGLCADLLVKGNGNMLERLLGPLPW